MIHQVSYQMHSAMCVYPTYLAGKSLRLSNKFMLGGLGCVLFILRSGYFAINSVLHLEAVLLLPFMCFKIAINTGILAVMLWCSGQGSCFEMQ